MKEHERDRDGQIQTAQAQRTRVNTGIIDECQLQATSGDLRVRDGSLALWLKAILSGKKESSNCSYLLLRKPFKFIMCTFAAHYFKMEVFQSPLTLLYNSLKVFFSKIATDITLLSYPCSYPLTKII